MTVAPLLPHEALLLDLLRRSARDGLRERIRLLDDLTLQAAFCRHADRHGVLGLALSTLERAPELTAALSQPAAAALLAPLPALRRVAALWDLECDRVLQSLQSGGVDPILLKGGALRRTTYPQSVERPAADLDLLVEEREMDAAVAALESARYEHAYGDRRALYRAHHFHFIMRHPAGFTVELHWALTTPTARVRLDVATFRARAIRLDGMRPVRVPSDEDMVLHLVCQHLDDGFGRLQRLVDIDRIVSARGDFAWPYLVEAARRGEAHSAAAVTLQLSRRLLGTALPRANAADMFAVPRVARAGIASVRPTVLPAHRFARGDDVRRAALACWVVRGSGGWFGGLGRMLSADHYRFWQVASDLPIPSAPQRVARAAKVLAFQAWSFATALLALASARGRDALRFWSG